jgi:hypothetical protein
MYMLISACAQWQRDVDSGRLPNHQNAQPLAGEGEVGSSRRKRGRSRLSMIIRAGGVFVQVQLSRGRDAGTINHRSRGANNVRQNSSRANHNGYDGCV